ncbi:hypothetical protein BDB01DRAFT_854837 [Pilobolus umbonatus]|nr:hypothetical protein BDB01DRAFT_854837 [Pilobolus umbonatus]
MNNLKNVQETTIWDVSKERNQTRTAYFGSENQRFSFMNKRVYLPLNSRKCKPRDESMATTGLAQPAGDLLSREKEKQKVDRLLSILVNDVEPDVTQNIQRINLNVGRMGPEERRRRKGQIQAEAIPEIVAEAMTNDQ